MAERTEIEWTDATWNPVTGCSIASPGCRHCYAMRLAGSRLKNHPSRRGLTRRGKAGPVWTGKVRLNDKWLIDPLRRRKPKRIFVCAHGDIFHPSVPDKWIDLVHAVMAQAARHDFQVLTKRSARMATYFNDPDLEERVRAAARELQLKYPRRRDLRQLPARPLFPLANEWLGVSVEDQRRTHRIDDLRRTPAALRFISFEPLLEGFDHLDLTGISWAIVGGESGPRARPMRVRWVQEINDLCFDQDVAFFFKQWGGPRPKSAGRLLDGALHDAIPERLEDGSYFIPLLSNNHNLDRACRETEAFLARLRA
ncbi:MAG: phage Gp37/Gp68 family protein [Alphaproteobacteria bacterium]|nr:phage Gp37/Gp68 family protein [Alphaproteobacteria bacterium]